jgi:hypothetical protein
LAAYVPPGSGVGNLQAPPPLGTLYVPSAATEAGDAAGVILHGAPSQEIPAAAAPYVTPLGLFSLFPTVSDLFSDFFCFVLDCFLLFSKTFENSKKLKNLKIAKQCSIGGV